MKTILFKSSYISFICILMFCHIIVKGQDQNNMKYDKIGNIKELVFDSNHPSPSSAEDFFYSKLNVKENNKFILKNKVNRPQGTVLEIYKQYYDSIEVESGIYILHYRNGKIFKGNGHLIKVDKLNSKPYLTAKDAFKHYLAYLSLQDTMIRFSHSLIIT
jgi:bacillolysin